MYLKKKEYPLQEAEEVPPRVEAPKLLPAKGFPNPAPKGAWVPKAQRKHVLLLFFPELSYW